MLPSSSSRVMRHSTWPAWWCESEPAVFVTAANHRSVPMATAGFSLKTDSNSGVISEPPPTPVMPTMAPTPNPLSIAMKSMNCPVHGLKASSPQASRAGNVLSFHMPRNNNFVGCLFLIGIRSGVSRHF